MVAGATRAYRRHAKSLTLGEGSLEAAASDCAHVGASTSPESPEVHPHPDASPLPLETLFPLDSDQVVAGVAHAMSLQISSDRTAELDPMLAIFDESKIEGPAFHGGEDEIKALLKMMVGLGLDPNVRARPPRLRGRALRGEPPGSRARSPPQPSAPRPPSRPPARSAAHRRSSLRACLSTGSCCSSAATRARARTGG
jgi:hypothetical protein